MWRTRCKGFSLVESLVAVVVLTTGLLGLARFQANLSRSALGATLTDNKYKYK